MSVGKIAPIVLVAATAASFWGVHTHDFINFDDDQFIIDNPAVRDGLSLSGLTWSLTSSHAGNWQPLTWLSHMLDCSLFGLNAGSHHLVSLLFHVLSGLLAFIVFSRLTGAPYRALWIALLFAVHPLRVESVAWAAQRKDVLSVCLLLLTVLAYVFYVKRPSFTRYVVTLAALTIGLTAKLTLITLPFALLLLDFWPLNRLQLTRADGFRSVREILSDKTVHRVLLEKVPMLVIIALATTITIWAKASSDSIRPEIAFDVRLATAATSYLQYFIKTVFPAGLSVFYPHSEAMPGWGELALALVVLVGISWLVVRMVSRRPYLFVGWFWFLGVLFPFVGILQVGDQEMANRFTYVPHLGLFLALVWLAADLTKARWRAAFVAAGAVVVVVLVVRSQIETRYWRDSISLFSRAVEVNPENFLAHNNLGFAYATTNDWETATAHYREAVRINPQFAMARNNLGTAAAQRGDHEQAVQHYRAALKVKSKFPRAENNLGVSLGELGRHEEARAIFERILARDPTDKTAHKNLGSAFFGEDRYDEALNHFSLALAIDSNDACTHNNAGAVYLRRADLTQAGEHFARAVELDPTHALAQKNLGAVLLRTGQLPEATLRLKEAARLLPKDTAIHNNLGIALIRQGNVADAVEEFRQAVTLAPEDGETLLNLGRALQMQGNSLEAVEPLSKAATLKPDSVAIRTMLADVLVAVGRTDEALEQLAAALKLRPDDSQILDRITKLSPP